MARSWNASPLLLLVWLAALGAAEALPVTPTSARQAALGVLRQHVATFGRWGASLAPAIGEVRPVTRDGRLVAYDVGVRPSGHVLVAADDELPPVPLYSDVSNFDAARAAEGRSVEAWIVSEVGRGVERARERARGRPPGTRPAGWAESSAGRAWRRLAPSVVARDPSSSLAGSAVPGAWPAATVVGPLLTTAWSQVEPYNSYTPAAPGCSHTVVGCTATAMAQLMRYWSWPASGNGSNAYAWDDDGKPSTPPLTLSASFEHPYDWGSMPSTVTLSSLPAEIDAVARLSSDAGIAVDMEYGCAASGASDALAATFALPNYFRYQVSSGPYSRADHTAAEFFARIQQELDASPRRPLLFVVWSVDVPPAGHALVMDGYQVTDLNLVHLNFGWGGSYQGWYTIDENWIAAYTWDAETQWVYPGIEPLPDWCTFALSAPGATVPAGGGVFSFSVDSLPGCTWAAREASLDQGWLAVTFGSLSGSGDGTVSYYVSPNPSASLRTGVVKAAGRTFTVTQNGTSAPSAFTKISPADGSPAVYASTTRLYWQASTGAASYQYCVDETHDAACGGSWVSTTSQLVTIALTPGKSYSWQVRAVNAAGTTEANAGTWWSFGTVPAPVFTDDPLVPGVTPVKAVHLAELRQRVAELRARHGLTAVAWTDPVLTPGDTTVKAIHVTEIQAALAAVYSWIGRPAPVYSTPAPATGVSIRAAHVSELRAAIVAAW